MSSRVSRPTDCSVPAMSRPSGWSGHMTSSKRFCTKSCGWSWYMRSSSRITDRSRSTSAGASLEFDMLGRHTRPVGGQLLVGGGVDETADTLDRVRDLLRGRPPLGALEEEMLDE